MNRLTRRFVLIAVAIVTTLTIGTVGFTVIAGYPPFDAFYMTLTTMTAVGYGEIHPLSHAGRVFNSFLIVFGVTTIFIAIGALTQTIIELEFGDAIGKRRKKRMIDNLKDHYIICGFQQFGLPAPTELSPAAAPSLPRPSPPLIPRRHNPLRPAPRQGAQSANLRRPPRRRGRLRSQDAPRRRRCRIRALLHYRPPPRAISIAPPRRPIPRLHHQGRRRGYRHRTGARHRIQRNGLQNHQGDAAAQGSGRHRDGNSQGNWPNALQPARRYRCAGPRLPHRDGPPRQSSHPRNPARRTPRRAPLVLIANRRLTLISGAFARNSLSAPGLP